MKILYTNFHDNDGGGHTTYVMSLIKALSRRHEIVLIAPATSRLYQEAAQLYGVRAHALNFSTKMPGIWQEMIWMRNFLRHERFDIAHVNGASDHRCVMLACVGIGNSRPRIVFTKHNDLPAKSFGNTLRARLSTDRVICVSGAVCKQLAETAYMRAGLRVVRNGVDTTYYAPWDIEVAQQARRRWLPKLPSNALVVGSNAGTAPWKGWLDMVRAIARLPSHLRGRVFVLMAGQPFNQEQQDEIQELGMSQQIVHAGLLQDVRPLIASLDVGFVLSWQVETISFACREMMAMGKPVIVSDKDGLVENVDNGMNGWIVPQRAPEAVMQLLVNILESPNNLTNKGLAARLKSETEFGIERFVQDTEQIYGELLAG